MKIGVVSSWNTDTGVAIHAETVCKAWIEMGHEVTVFTFTKEDFHGEGFTGEDEDYVIRCFGTRRTNALDPTPILKRQFDIFVVQDLSMLPVDNLAKIFPLIHKKAKTVHVVHENALPRDAWFYQFEWDEVVYFSHRQNFLNSVYENAKLIHFPCLPVRKKDKIEARKALDLPADKRIVYEFCQRGYRPFLRELPDELKEKAILLILIPPNYEFLEEANPPRWMVVRREETLSHEKFDDYLFASDATIFHKFQSRYRAVVSSTVFQAIGADCPILVPGQSDFFFPFKEEVIRYADSEDLKSTLVDLFEDGQIYKMQKERAENFVRENSAEVIAQKFIDLFEALLKNDA